jgi:hypothetical protein
VSSAWYDSLEERIEEKMIRNLAVVCCLLGVGCTTVNSNGHVERNAGGRAFWSLVIPGVGQFTNGEYGKGALMMGLNVLNNASYSSISDPDEAAARYDSFMAVSLLIGGWSAADAYKVATDLNRTSPIQRTYGQSIPTEPTPLTVALDPFTQTALAQYCYRF